MCPPIVVNMWLVLAFSFLTLVPRVHLARTTVPALTAGGGGATVLVVVQPRKGLRPTRQTYEDIHQYRCIWRELIRAVAEHEQRQCLAMQRDNITVAWEYDVNRSLVAVIPWRGRVRVGDMFSVKGTALVEGEQTAWRATGAVRQVRIQKETLVAVSLPEAPKEAREVRTGYTVTPEWNSTNYERMQTSLKLGHVDV